MFLNFLWFWDVVYKRQIEGWRFIIKTSKSIKTHRMAQKREENSKNGQYLHCSVESSKFELKKGNYLKTSTSFWQTYNSSTKCKQTVTFSPTALPLSLTSRSAKLSCGVIWQVPVALISSMVTVPSSLTECLIRWLESALTAMLELELLASAANSW